MKRLSLISAIISALGVAGAFAAAPPKHWAFQPVQSPDVPKVKNADWVANPIDAFIAARHEEKGLTPAPSADRRKLLRRLSFTLTGLPPTPEEIAVFEKDQSADAYATQVKRLLASPRYGERWARHWLDLARFADSEGYESDHPRPYAWRYRDYVVKAFNEDKPYDRFVLEQLAGDELTPYSDENLIATGFLAAARISSNEEDRARQFNDIYVDIVNATAGTFLGLTMHCAQCHNHKLDPISQKDYYRFLGFFVKGMPNNLALRDPDGWKPYNTAKPPEYDSARSLLDAILEKSKAKAKAELLQKLTPDQRSALDTPPEKRTVEQQRIAIEAEAQMQISGGMIDRNIPPEDKALVEELKKKVAAIEKTLPEMPQTFGFYSPATSPNKVNVLPMKGFYPPPYKPEELSRATPFVLLGGDVKRRGDRLAAGWPEVLGAIESDVAEKGSRSTLAKWLTDPKNPLTARVWVNRIWQRHFGRGLVSTSSDFGLNGAPPTHPELLDWLASELIRANWSTKHIQRLIVSSNTYQQAIAKLNDTDPDNLLLSRWSPRRLEAEAIRDSWLMVSGELDEKMGGAPDADEPASKRRSLYLIQKRQKPIAVLSLFDAPVAATESCSQRLTSTVPLQALYLLNNDTSMKRAKALAERVLKQAGNDRDKQIETAFRLAFGRLPDTKELHGSMKILTELTADNALTLFCQALMNASEFVYIE